MKIKVDLHEFDGDNEDTVLATLSLDGINGEIEYSGDNVESAKHIVEHTINRAKVLGHPKMESNIDIMSNLWDAVTLSSRIYFTEPEEVEGDNGDTEERS